jgi:excinuclease UvrABC nuclease subunit
MSRIGVRAVVARLPSGPGVYRFADDRGRTLYVGRAVDLRRRAGSYWGDLGDRWHLRRMVARIARIDALVCDSGHEAAWLERNVLQRSLPPWNRTVGGQEVPLSIVVDLDPPGLHTVHDVGASPLVFGPYLGGTQVRLAVSGLLRAFPLHYAASGLSGSALDLARVRGYSAADAGDLLNAAIAVLRRDPAAVAAFHARLTTRRDAAAGAQAYELAARIQSEIEAVGWISEEQKVHRAGGADCVAYGFADGHLLRLEITRGLLDGWRVRPATSRTAERPVAETPPHWKAFAQRNAELAASLRA